MRKREREREREGGRERERERERVVATGPNTKAAFTSFPNSLITIELLRSVCALELRVG